MKRSPLFLLFPLLCSTLFSCNQEAGSSKVKLLHGQVHGEVSRWNEIESNSDITESTDFANLDYLNEVPYSSIVSKVEEKENFLLVVKGASNGCSCWQEFHRQLSRSIKKHRLLVYVIDLEKFEKEDEHYGIKLSEGRDTICVFENGSLRYQKTDSDSWPNQDETVGDWLSDRIEDPRLFDLSFSQLDQLYAGSQAFTVYFGRKTCGDCKYIEKTSLKEFFFSAKSTERNTFFVDFDEYRSLTDEQGVSHSLNDTAIYSEGVTWGQHVQAIYNGKKAEYGLVESEENPAGYLTGVVPTFFHINPSEGKKTGSVIDGAAVFYNETMNGDNIEATYFTSTRLDDSYMEWLSESSLEKKTILGEAVTGYASASTREEKHDLLRSLEEPFIKAFLNYYVAL